MQDALTLCRPDASSLGPLAEVAHRAFRLDPVSDHWHTHIAQNPYVHRGDAVSVSCGETPVGAAFGLDFEMTYRGRALSMLGVAGVAVRPEYRRRGIADMMMKSLVAEARTRRYAVSLLHPFSQRYYARFGYARVESTEVLRAAPSQFFSSPLAARVEALDLTRGAEVLKQLYAQSRGDGALTRDAWWWQHRVLRPNTDAAVFREPGSDAITGYVLFMVPGAPGYPRQHLVVRELIATTPAAHQGLCGWLAALGDQFAVVRWSLPLGSAQTVLREHGVVDAPESYLPFDPMAVVAGGMMARLIDVAGALRAHAGLASLPDGPGFGLDLGDPLGPAPFDSYDVRLGPAGVEVAPGRREGLRVEIGIGAMTQLYFSAARLADLVAMGRAVAPAELVARLDPLFAGARLCLGSGNYF
ncbi:MAG: GNAT family N-acetyltransferase [Myxococcales bacterium]|nr:GNAT family N-acetyltransferase [Myxococcales bacterium]